MKAILAVLVLVVLTGCASQATTLDNFCIVTYDEVDARLQEEMIRKFTTKYFVGALSRPGKIHTSTK